jgi:threonine dehydratase
MAASIIAGRLVRLREKKTIADAVAGGIEPGSITFPLCQKYVDEFLTVTESQIKKSIAALHREHGQVVEGAGALPLAALFKDSDAFRGRKVVLVASGGNIAQDLFRKIAGKSRARKP